MGSSRHVLQGQVDGAYPLPVTVSPSPDLDHLAEAGSSRAPVAPVLREPPDWNATLRRCAQSQRPALLV